MEKIKITDIIPSEYNPRSISDNELKTLENSINELGFIDPIIINNKNKKIIGGHQRYKILKKQGINELFLFNLGDISWVFSQDELDIKSEDHEKAANLALNKISGEWDNQKLDEILDDFSRKGFDISLTGFDNLTNIENKTMFGNIELDDDNFFNTTFTEEDDVDDVEIDEFKLKALQTIIQLGDFTVTLDTTIFNYWIKHIEKEELFNLENTKQRLREMVGI